MQSILKKYQEYPLINDIVAEIKNSNSIQISNTKGSAKSFILAVLFKKINKPLVVSFSDKETAAYIYNDLQTILETENIYFFPSSIRHSNIKDLIKSDISSMMMRTETLLKMDKNNYIILTYPEALSESIVKKEEIKKNIIEISKGESVDFNFLIEMLEELELRQVDFVMEPGQFALRGSIIDVFSFSDQFPYRLDFFGDQIESIRIFDTDTQLSTKNIDKISIINNLHLSSNSKIEFSSFFDYSKDAIIILDDEKYLIDKITDIYSNSDTISIKEQDDETKKYIKFIDPEIIKSQLNKFQKIYLNNKEIKNISKFNFKISPQPALRKKFDILAQHLQEKKDQNYSLFICSKSKNQLKRLEQIFQSEEINTKVEFTAVQGEIYQGFADETIKVLLYTDHQIFDKFLPYKLKNYTVSKSKEAELIKEIKELKQGDYVVHIDYGIGIFKGITTIENNGKRQEVVSIAYKDNDNVFVSIHSLYKISKYKSESDQPPTIHKLGSSVWNKLKNKTKSRIKDIAKDLIKLYAQRLKQQGFAFSHDSFLQEELEARFIYEETPDQIETIKAVKADMEKQIPMDRLVCGDVGFGKTEIAIRAAFKAVADGKQVALLCPTTILAFQHYRTFTERLSDFPVAVDYLSRMRNYKEQKNIIEKLKKSAIDIIIGTHRIVSKDVGFKDLGLLIIDEEQRFGVAVKEKLRQLRPNIDTLTLTATPIPRTLEFSLMGARDLSILQTPPQNRQPIITEVHTFNIELIKNAIEYEVNRNGQVFFVHNHVASLPKMKEMIQKAIPDISIKIAHGKMSPTETEKIITAFIKGDFDVLLTTTIIENGLDIPNANTIIINNAHKFGLSHLHQLRGRVGRSNKKAFCYLLAPPKINLTPEARRRLDAIENFVELGSGFNIALQDLDIRGAGDLLGAQQSGFINNIGYETFKRILEEAMIELKTTDFKDIFSKQEENEKEQKYVADCQINTDLDIGFPDDYIPSTNEKLKLYKQLETITDKEKLEEYRKNIIDRFGKLPKKAEELLNIVLLRNLGIPLGIEKIVLKQGVFINYFVADKNSAFYDSNIFKNKILQYTVHSHSCEMKQKNDNLYLKFKNVKSIAQALNILQKIYNY